MKITNTKIDGVLVDDVDVDLNGSRWCLDNRQYVYRSIYGGGKQRNEKLHRLVLARMLGRSLQPGEVGDHINGNKLDNHRSNLRVATHQQNAWNRAPQRGSRSKYSGVWISNRSKRWAAFVKRDGVRYHIGYFDTDDEAAWMRDQWASTLHGEYARLNFEYFPVA